MLGPGLVLGLPTCRVDVSASTGFLEFDCILICAFFSGQHEWQGIYIKRSDLVYVPLTGEEEDDFAIHKLWKSQSVHLLICVPPKSNWKNYVSFRMTCCPGARCRVVFSDRSVTSEHLPTHANNDSHATSNTRLPLFQPSTPSDMLEQTPHFTTSGEGSGCSHTTRSQSVGQQIGKCQGQNFYRLLTQMSENKFQPLRAIIHHTHSFLYVFLVIPHCRKRQWYFSGCTVYHLFMFRLRFWTQNEKK